MLDVLTVWFSAYRLIKAASSGSADWKSGFNQANGDRRGRADCPRQQGGGKCFDVTMTAETKGSAGGERVFSSAISIRANAA